MRTYISQIYEPYAIKMGVSPEIPISPRKKSIYKNENGLKGSPKSLNYYICLAQNDHLPISEWLVFAEYFTISNLLNMKNNTQDAYSPRCLF